MKEFISHVDYLVQKHDCVIIPEFGGFVLSHEGAIFASDGSILPPKVTVGFNPDLNYNDGLLAESYMSVHSITYEVACKRISDAVKRLNTILSMRHPVQMGRLGSLCLDKDDKLSFIPNSNLSIFHPETFGLSAVNMKRLVEIDQDVSKTKKKSIYRRIFGGISATAAAILVFFMASTPISENKEMYRSSLFTDIISSAASEYPIFKESKEKVDLVKIIEEEYASNADYFVLENTDDLAEESLEQEKSEKSLDYYVVISSAGTNSEAQTLVDKFKNAGFAKSDVLTSGGKIRIYAEAFATRAEAERYLTSIKENSSQFHDAWVCFIK